jgi:hypothetical protein
MKITFFLRCDVISIFGVDETSLHSSTLQMESAVSSETLINIYQAPRPHNQNDINYQKWNSSDTSRVYLKYEISSKSSQELNEIKYTDRQFEETFP